MSREMHAVTKMAKIRQNWQIRPTYPPTHPTDSLMNPTPPLPLNPLNFTGNDQRVKHIEET